MASAGKEDQVSATPTIDAGLARALLSSESGGHAYIDVRLPMDFDKEHAAGARNVPYYFAVTPQGKEKNPRFVEEVAALYGKEQHLIVGCYTGVRSKLATVDLVNAGYENARSLQALQESHEVPTAVSYADGQTSGPSAYGPASPAPRLTPRRSEAVGVARHTPTVALGVCLPLGVSLRRQPSPTVP